MSWNKIKFKKFITLQRGFDLPITEMKDGKIPVLGSTCIVGYHDKAKVKPPGVITGRSGTIGVVQYIDKPYWPHNTSLWIKDFKLNYPKFVYYKMKTLNFNRFNGGASVPTLNRNNLDNLIVLIPDIKTQKKIAEILSTYDDLIDVNSWRIELLEESARLLFREWFVYFRFPGHEKVKIVDRDGRKMPVEWDYLPFTKIKIFKKAPLGVPVFTDARQYYQTSEINSTTIIGDGVEVDYENRPSRANIAPTISTVYFAKMKDTDKVLYFNRGNSFLLEKILLSTGMVGFATDKKYLGFLFSLLKSYEFVKYKNNFATGATQVSLNNASLKKIKVLFPTQNLVELYSEIVNPLLEECSYLRCQNQKLAQARDLLLPRLMNGTIDVSELNTKIPEEAEI